MTKKLAQNSVNHRDRISGDYNTDRSPGAIVKKLLLITLGAVIYSAGIALFLDSNGLAVGGFTGIATILSHWLPLGIGTGIYILIFNIPVLIIGAVRFKGEYLFYTIYTIVLSSSLMELLRKLLPQQYMPMSKDLLISAIVGGAMVGAGMALVYRGGGSTGGSDIIIKLIRQHYPHLRTGTIFRIFDFSVVALSAFQFEIEHALVAAISVVVTSYVLDLVLYGGLTAKFIYIMSARSDAIADRLLKEALIGMTKLDGRGGYTGNEQQVLMCAFHKQYYQKVRNIVKEEDPHAFMIVTSAHEVFGEGFQNPFADEI